MHRVPLSSSSSPLPSSVMESKTFPCKIEYLENAKTLHSRGPRDGRVTFLADKVSLYTDDDYDENEGLIGEFVSKNNQTTLILYFFFTLNLL